MKILDTQYPTPDRVRRLWLIPVKDLPPIRWIYYSPIAGWRPCVNYVEAAWRMVKGYPVELVKPTPSFDPQTGAWTGWSTKHLALPVKGDF